MAPTLNLSNRIHKNGNIVMSETVSIGTYNVASNSSSALDLINETNLDIIGFNELYEVSFVISTI